MAAAPPVQAPTVGDQIVPVKNPKALFAYYCAVFGMIPGVSAVLGPVAFVLGILARSAIMKNAGLPGKVHAWVGIVLGAIETLLSLAVIVTILMG